MAVQHKFSCLLGQLKHRRKDIRTALKLDKKCVALAFFQNFEGLVVLFDTFFYQTKQIYIRPVNGKMSMIKVLAL